MCNEICSVFIFTLDAEFTCYHENPEDQKTNLTQN